MIAVKTYYLHATQVIEKMVHPTEFESVTSAFGGHSATCNWLFFIAFPFFYTVNVTKTSLRS